MFIKVQNNIATREPVPDFLPRDREALADLSVVSAPGFDFSDVTWLPEVDQTPALGPDQTHDGTEVLTVDATLQVVLVVRGVRDLTPEEIHQRWLADNPVPFEVLRYCGLLALKRHCLVQGQLQELAENQSWDSGSLYSDVQQFRASMLPGEARDRLDVALNDVLYWSRTSPTVADLCEVLPLSPAQADALFIWAKAREAML